MAATDELIDQLGGAGPVGVVIAAAVLAPAVFPPVRRSLRGLAKVAIIQYLRVTEPKAPAARRLEAPAAAGPEPRRRGRRAGATSPRAEEAASPEPPQLAP